MASSIAHILTKSCPFTPEMAAGRPQSPPGQEHTAMDRAAGGYFARDAKAGRGRKKTSRVTHMTNDLQRWSIEFKRFEAGQSARGHMTSASCILYIRNGHHNALDRSGTYKINMLT
eukprot:scpid98495/ scgid22165/ 